MIYDFIFGRLSKSLTVTLLLCGPSLDLVSIARADPFSSNNGLYPDPASYSGRFNISNLDYPTELPKMTWDSGVDFSEYGLTKEKAPEYAEALKTHIGESIRGLVENAQSWDPFEKGWYNVMWRGAGTRGDPSSGREAIMNTNTGQIVPSISWSEQYRPIPEFAQNYGVIYFNPTAAYMLGQVWKDPYKPNLNAQFYPEGSIVVKVEAATVQPNEWPWYDEPAAGGSVLNGASEWQVFRPTTIEQKLHQRDPDFKMRNVVQTVYPFQIAIRVKDKDASPQTGWVFLGYVFDARVEADNVWDKFVPAGMMWGNDPKHALTKSQLSAGDQLEESWINPDAPPFVKDTLGWGGRFAAPMDVAVRHNVVFPSGMRPEKGLRVSSCLSCHGAAQFPLAANIYPSPNLKLPADGDNFPLYNPGSAQWAQWFQNRPGTQPQSNYPGVSALDYDLTTMIALGAWARSTGKRAQAFGDINGH